MKKQKTIKKPPVAAIQDKIIPSKESYSDRITWLVVLTLFCFMTVIVINKNNSAYNNRQEFIKPNYSFASWLTGDFQDSYENYVKNKPYFGKQLLQVKNQVDYNYLSKFNVAGAVVGKHNNIFLEVHIKAALGLDYAGDSLIASRVKKLEVIQDTLKRKGIDLITVFAPGKGCYFKEDFPDSYSKYPKKKTNFEEYLSRFRKSRLKYIDLKTWFEKHKATTKYPYFSPYGMHWTYYAQCLTVDTICKYISKVRNTPVNHITWNDIEVTKQPKYEDDDLLRKGRLAESPPYRIDYAYPKVNYMTSPDIPKTKLLRIGDSFCGSFLVLPALGKLFEDGKFWYYGNTVYPDTYTQRKEVWELNVKEAIEENQVLLLLYTDHNLGGFGNNFIDDVYELYTSPATYKKKMEANKTLFVYRKEVRSNPTLMKEIEVEAQKLSISVDSLIYLRAMKLSKQSVK